MPVADAFRPDLVLFTSLSATADGRAWLARLPELVEDVEDAWGVHTGEPFDVGVAGWTAPAVVGATGEEVVVKISYPHREAREEATALALWDGHGAVRLLRADRERWALLLERCVPGTRLVDAGLPADEARAVAAAALVGLWSISPDAAEAARFERVADVCAEWAELVHRRMDELAPPFDPGLVRLGASLLEDLPRSASRTVVVHGDFNPGNVLAAAREPWLAVDPKPMVGDPGYDPSPMVLQLDDERRPLRDRFAHFADLVDEPLDRLLAWTVARKVESALWHVSRDELDDGSSEIALARDAASLAGL